MLKPKLNLTEDMALYKDLKNERKIFKCKLIQIM